eukprot:441918-Ditylum_brightwellii.AAC.1
MSGWISASLANSPAHSVFCSFALCGSVWLVSNYHFGVPGSNAMGSSKCVMCVIFAARAVCIVVNSASTDVLPCAKFLARSSLIHMIAARDSAVTALHASGLRSCTLLSTSFT